MVDQQPKISIVTPILNQARFIEESILSVLSQNYPNVEYVVMDGGSTDGSAEIIRKHADKLAYWSSAPDEGQYSAINEGFSRTDGEIMAWLNADDKYFPWTFDIVGEIFSTFKEVEWITSTLNMYWDAKGRPVDFYYRPKHTRKSFLKGENLPNSGWYAQGFIQQESTFWRRSLWEKVGSHIDTSFKYAGDFDLWARFYRHAQLRGVGAPLGGFRRHGEQKTAYHFQDYLIEARASLINNGGRARGSMASLFRSNLIRFVPKFIAGPLGLTESSANYINRNYEGRWVLVSLEDPDFNI